MFTVEIAGVSIEINNYYSGVEDLCKDYITDKKPVFTVEAPLEDIASMAQNESSGPEHACGGSSLTKEYSYSYAEQLCIYRQISLALINYDAFLMHAAIIDVDGDGVAFAAGSGTGKSTRVRLWREAFGNRVAVVNGDKPILRFIDGKLFAFGTPWMGKEGWGTNTRVPLKYVCFLERSEDVSLKQLDVGQTMSFLFKQILLPKEKGQIERFMKLLDRFMKSCSFYLLKCNQEKEKPEEIWGKMKKSCRLKENNSKM